MENLQLLQPHGVRINKIHLKCGESETRSILISYLVHTACTLKYIMYKKVGMKVQYLFSRYPGGFTATSAWRAHDADPTFVSNLDRFLD